MELSGVAAYIQNKVDVARYLGHICKHCGQAIALTATRPNGDHHIASFMELCDDRKHVAEL